MLGKCTRLWSVLGLNQAHKNGHKYVCILYVFYSIFLTLYFGASNEMYLFISLAMRGCLLNTEPSTATDACLRSIRRSNVAIPVKKFFLTYILLSQHTYVRGSEK